MDEHTKERLTQAQVSIEQFEDSNDYQRGCTAEATKLWQQAHNQPDTLPDIGVLINWLALEIENKQYTITCAAHEIADLRELLAEARAEIERLRQENVELLVKYDEKFDVIDAKDKLIEQMREALKIADILIDDLVDTHVEKCASVYDDDRNEIKAALSAAERGE